MRYGITTLAFCQWRISEKSDVKRDDGDGRDYALYHVRKVSKHEGVDEYCAQIEERAYAQEVDVCVPLAKIRD